MYTTGYGSYYSDPYYYSYSAPHSAMSTFAGFIGGMVMSFWLIFLVLTVIYLIGLWKVFAKAGYAGWESLIGGHNLFVQFVMSGIKGYWMFLLFIPLVNLAIIMWKDIELAKSFGRSVGFGIGMFFLPYIFIPILGFGKSRYEGPAYCENNNVQNNYQGNYNYNNNNNSNNNMNNNNMNNNSNMNNNNDNNNNNNNAQ